MKLKIGYEALTATISSMAVVVEDTLNNDDMKAIIVKVSSDKKIQLIGMNQMIIYKADLPEDSYEVEATEEDFNTNGVFYLQVKSKELTSFLNTFKSVRRTKVSNTVFEFEKNKIKLSVIEESLDTGDNYKSTWWFDNIPIKQALLKSIDVTIPKETVTMSTEPLQLYTSCLLPILQNSTTLNGMMQFGSDEVDEDGNMVEPSRVTAFTPTFNTLMANQLPDYFRGMSIYYRSILFLKNIVCAYDMVNVSRTDQFLCFSDEGKFEAFVRYTTRVADYRPYLQMFDKSHALELDRQYFKDVLKRLSLVDEQVEISVDESLLAISVRNSKFSQEIPVLREKNMAELGKISFRIKPEVLEKTIIGDDSLFSPTIFMYITPQERGGWTLVFSDDTGVWFSVARIR